MSLFSLPYASLTSLLLAPRSYFYTTSLLYVTFRLHDTLKILYNISFLILPSSPSSSPHVVLYVYIRTEKIILKADVYISRFPHTHTLLYFITSIIHISFSLQNRNCPFIAINFWRGTLIIFKIFFHLYIKTKT